MTGVIMEPLPVDKIVAGMPQAIANLKTDNWFDATHAIMTTDIVAKAVSRQVQFGGKTVTINLTRDQATRYQPWFDTAHDIRDTLARIEELSLRIASRDENWPESRD